MHLFTIFFYLFKHFFCTIVLLSFGSIISFVFLQDISFSDKTIYITSFKWLKTRNKTINAENITRLRFEFNRRYSRYDNDYSPGHKSIIKVKRGNLKQYAIVAELRLIDRLELKTYLEKWCLQNNITFIYRET